VATLGTLPADAHALQGDAGQVGGFSLHAGVVAQAHERDQLERLCRYITRPAIAARRLSISPQGRVRYELKTPWRNGATHVEFEPVDFIGKLAALVSPPRAHLTRFHGIFAPKASLRAQLTPAGRGRRPTADAALADSPACTDHRTPAERRRSMTWAQRLKRVFNIDVTTCVHCGGAVRIVASIEEPAAIRTILAYFAKHDALEEAHYRLGPRAPPPAELSMRERQRSVDERDLTRRIESLDQRLKAGADDDRSLRKAKSDLEELLLRHRRLASRKAAVEAAILSLPDAVEEIYQAVITQSAAGGGGPKLNEALERLRLEEELEQSYGQELAAIAPSAAVKARPALQVVKR
jgi:hypothetical protein